nr:hypothetical protein [uncultured Lacibacter sp.]
MKTSIFFSIIFFFCLTFTNAQEITSWHSEKLQGKVKRLKTSSYKTAEKFGEIEKTTNLYTTEAIFNSNGYLTTYLFDNGKTSETTEYKYNKNNLLTEYRTREYGRPVIFKFLYNNYGKASEVNKYDKKSGDLIEKQKNKYADDSSLTRSDFYNADGSLYQTEEFEYMVTFRKPLLKKQVNKPARTEKNWALHKSSNEEEVEWYFEGKNTLEHPKYLEQKEEYARLLNDTTQNSIGLFVLLLDQQLHIGPLTPEKNAVTETISIFNKKNQLIKKTERERKKGAADFQLKSETIYEYDQYGNITLEKKSRLLYTTYKYTYDKYGNWLTQLETHKAGDNSFSFYTERSITYY